MSFEKCYYYLGICWELEWGEIYCMVEYVVYLVNLFGLKVGIIWGIQVFMCWID